MPESHYIQAVDFTVQTMFDSILSQEQLIIYNELKSYFINFLVSPKTRVDGVILITKWRKGRSFVDQKGSELTLYLKPLKGKEIKRYIYINMTRIRVAIRIILHNLLYQRNGFFLHCSANLVHNQAVLFLAPSGTGKSTISRLINSQFPSITDDFGIFRKISNKYYYFQVPFVDKGNLVIKSKRRYLIRAVFFLQKSPKFQLSQIVNHADYLPNFIGQLYTKNNHKQKQLEYVIAAIKQIPKFYLLKFNLNKAKIIEKLTYL